MLRQAVDDDVPAITACVLHAYARYADRIAYPPEPVLADYAAVVREKATWLLEQAGQLDVGGEIKEFAVVVRRDESVMAGVRRS